MILASGSAALRRERHAQMVNPTIRENATAAKAITASLRPLTLRGREDEGVSRILAASAAATGASCSGA
ncbi:MAG TPA: hypothetical protein VMQ56_11180 [Terracidiphilus sp.]|nr:hypothetical protein [Terracidiphilus sp.]